MTTEHATSIGPYRVIAKLGQGGMAHVLLALKPGPAGFRKLLVIKQLRKELVEDQEYLSMFLDEARLAARLAHNNVVRTYEVGEHEDGMFIAMDYLEGQPLNRVIRRKPKLALAAHIRILSEVLSGLHYAHNLQDFDGSPLNVIHRDVSPHNVFVTYNGEVQVLDFGIAKAAGATSQTREGTFKGKVSYIAPEQALAQNPDRRADIFSVGIMLWEAVAQRRLWKGGQDLAHLNARIKGAEPRLRDVMPDADPLLLDVADKAMALDPNDRFQTAEEFRQALKPYLREHAATPEDLGRWMSGSFAAERKELREKIDRQIQAHEDATHSAEIPVVNVGTTAPTPLTGQVPTPVSGDGNKRFWMGLAAAAIVVGAAALAFVGTDDPSAPVVEPTAPEPPAIEAGPTALEAPPAAAPIEAPPAAETIDLHISAEPAGARLFLDGARLNANPFQAGVEASGEMHRLRVTAEGYVDHEQVLVFDQDRRLDIVLDEAPVVGAARMRRGGMRGVRNPTPEPVEQVVEAAPVAPPPPPPAMVTMEPTPTPTPTPRGPQPRQIDETNPY